ncbi:MAG: hypothetical protein AAGI92_09650 [Pseudomonadota bacterium]
MAKRHTQDIRTYLCVDHDGANCIEVSTPIVVAVPRKQAKRKRGLKRTRSVRLHLRLNTTKRTKIFLKQLDARPSNVALGAPI